MAIVKFVSDKDCQVFIDMELVGKVASESMLKVTLETGGYLIQVKDEDGNLIKEYDLEIKPSDNQLLQKIDKTNDKLDDVIEILKNDSSLVFHCNRASFSHNGLYGFVDKKLNVVIPPIYFSVNEFVDDKAFVVRDFPEGRKTTMIDSDGNMFFNRWFDFIGESDETILLGIDNRIFVYSKTKCDKIAEYFNAGYDHKYPIVPVYKKVGAYNFYGYINFDGKEAIPFIFDNVGNFNEKGEADVVFLGREVKIDVRGYYQERENGYYYKTSWNGDLQGLDGIFELMPNPCSYDTGVTSWHFSPIWNDYKWIVRIITKDYNKRVIKEADFYCDYVIRAGTGYWICKQEGKVLVLIANIYNNGVEEFTFDADDVEPVFDINENLQGDDIITPRTFVVKKDNKYGALDTSGKEIIPIEFDEIIPFTTYEFTVRKARKYGLYINGILSDLEFDKISQHYNTNHKFCGYLLEKDSKFGLWKNWDVISPIYDTIENYEIDGYGDRIIVSVDGKYGIIDNKQKEILPINFEKIIPMNDFYFVIRKSEGYSFGCMKNGQVFPEIYDNISLFENNNDNDIRAHLKFAKVIKNGKQGCISTENGKIKIPIDYDIIELGCVNRHYPEIVSVSFLLYQDSKCGYCEYGYYYVQRDFHPIIGSSYDGPFEYLYTVKPDYEECVLLANEYSVLSHYYMHYAAVRKGNKWGILDQKVRAITYQAMHLNIEDENTPNYKDLDFKYNSLDELKDDAENELKRRFDYYYHPWTIRTNSQGEDYIVIKEAEK